MLVAETLQPTIEWVEEADASTFFNLTDRKLAAWDAVVAQVPAILDR
jgi:hypothetical protein